ncbi:MAG TPA: glycosyltransferase family 2 protein [Steroidobacteraceae bacterium]|jgi:glycosyltransferase involved in cell wall biosynthesis
MKIGVILSTYNAPQRLEPTLIGYAAQSHRDFELIVADDGSGEDTRELIRATAARFARPIRHVWQEDVGFRKCRILNQAILSTQAEYLIFSDGDCIPREDFVAVHATAAKPGRFLSGGYFKLPAATTAAVTESDILAGRVTAAQWLVDNGTPRDRKLAKLQARGWQAKLFNALTPTAPTWNGHNASGWRTDLLQVNGFDERMAYWAQDREFGERLVNAGIRGLQVRYSAICVHLHHERPYKTDESMERNRKIRRDTRRERKTWTQHGIVKGKSRQVRATATDVAADVAVRNYQIS